MQVLDIMQEIQQLPLDKKFWVVEETIKSIKFEEANHQLAFAANELFEDYKTDKELTAFSTLDFEQFYEAK
jgi:hypothetical protein